LRTTKLRYVSRLFKQYIEKFIARLKSDDLIIENNNLDEEGEMNRFILNELAGFAGGILFESSLLLALDASLNYNAFALRNVPMNFDYVNSAYFVIISFSTVGFGDIVPIVR
jgi:Ion channel